MSEYEPYDAPAHEEPVAEYPSEHDDSLIGSAIGEPLFESGAYEAGHEPGPYDPGQERGYDPEHIEHQRAEAGYPEGGYPEGGHPEAGHLEAGHQEPTYAGEGYAGQGTEYAGEGAYVNEDTSHAGAQGSSGTFEDNPEYRPAQ